MHALTAKQLETVCAVYMHRALTRHQLERFMPDGRSTPAWTQHLRRVELVGALERVRVGQGPVWMVTEDGAAAAEASGRVPVRAWRPGPGIRLAPDHVLSANEVWLEFYAAAAQADDECGVWDGDLEVLHKHGRERLITDVRLEYTRRQGKRVVTWVLLVEIDRGTRKLTDLYGQVRAYARLHSRQRAWAQAYRVWPRVLIVLAGMEHQAALRRARRLRELCAADPEIGPAVRAAVTTQALLRQGPLGDVWLPLGAPPLSPAVSLLELRSIREAAS